MRQDLKDLERSAIRLVTIATRAIGGPDKGRRVALRRALGRPPEHPAARGAHMVVAPVLPMGSDPALERAWYAVAAMMAAQPRDARSESIGGEDDAETTQESDLSPSPPEADADDSAEERQTLGATLGRAVALGTLREDTIEARLHLMCRQDLEGIHRHLPRLIATLRADLVPVDWVRLAVDLARWGDDRDRVAKKWLQDYYRTLQAEKARRKKADKPSSSEGEDQ